ncbi:MAG: hypothetical protein PHQ23_11300 [Candidatus Wallbacteria bacterium]|nr:hypothetical protein [Candidatus Wallbacteria bacterium]
MLVKELVLELANKPGQLYRAVSIIRDSGVDIKAVTCIKDSETATKVKVIALDYQKAMKALKQAKIKAYENEVIIADIEDRLGEFARVLKLVADENVNIEYVYTTLSYIPCRVLVVLDCSDSDTRKALEVLKNNHITIVSDHTIKGTCDSGSYYEERNIKEYLTTVITP